MARPRKDAAEPCARVRLIDAFWQLASDGSGTELSVGAVTRVAGCNRGTFYYHFKDIDELRHAAVDQLLFGDDALTDAIWDATLKGDIQTLLGEGLGERLHRLVLAMETGSAHAINRLVRQTAIERWTLVACPDGGALAPDACFAIQFMVSGIMSLIVAVGYAREGRADGEGLPKIEVGSEACSYLASVASATVDTIAAAQGIERDDILARLNSNWDILPGANCPTSPQSQRLRSTRETC